MNPFFFDYHLNKWVPFQPIVTRAVIDSSAKMYAPVSNENTKYQWFDTVGKPIKDARESSIIFNSVKEQDFGFYKLKEFSHQKISARLFQLKNASEDAVPQQDSVPKAHSSCRDFKPSVEISPTFQNQTLPAQPEFYTEKSDNSDLNPDLTTNPSRTPSLSLHPQLEENSARFEPNSNLNPTESRITKILFYFCIVIMTILKMTLRLWDIYMRISCKYNKYTTINACPMHSRGLNPKKYNFQREISWV